MRPTKIRSSHKDIGEIGSLYDQWKIVERPRSFKGTYKVKCECSCGKIKYVKTHNLLKGKSKSCGCVQRNNLPSMSKGKQSWNAVTAEHKAVTDLINQYKHSAKKRQLVYSLVRKEFETLIKQDCFYCGSPPSNSKAVKGTRYAYNGIDRFDNTFGYVIDNCKPCCYTCNIMKLDMTSQEFMEHITRIKSNNKLTKNFSIKKMTAYHARALAVASQSHDIHTQVGALLINPKTAAVMAEGYNGFIRGAQDSTLPTTRPEKYDYIIHAETNLLCNAVRSGVQTDDAVVYCTLSPCVKCLRMLWQAGISEFYFSEKYKDFDQCTSMLDIEATISNIDNFYKLTIRPKQ